VNAYNDLEIQCFVDAIDRYKLAEDSKPEEKSARLVDVLRESAHVLELLLEPQAARHMRDIAEDLDFNLFGLQEDFNEYKEEVELFLDDELGCSTLEAARAEAGEAGWVKLPASVDRYDAEQLLKEFGDSNLELLDLLDAVKELSHE
jgi:hypothetical protein